MPGGTDACFCMEGAAPAGLSTSLIPDMRKEGRTVWEMLRARSRENVPKAAERGELGDWVIGPESMTKGPIELVSTRRVGVVGVVMMIGN